MVLSYSFETRITSGFAKGTESAELNSVLRQMSKCAYFAAHPLLLPVLMLNKQISVANDERQRSLRHELRKVESGMSRRYTKVGSGISKPFLRKDSLEQEEQDRLMNLDTLNSKLTECHCNILWKSPLAWKHAVSSLQEAATFFWEKLPDEQKDADLEKLHNELLCRLRFIFIKLSGLESYRHVSLERLSLQRDVVRLAPHSYIYYSRYHTKPL